MLSATTLTTARRVSKRLPRTLAVIAVAMTSPLAAQLSPSVATYTQNVEPALSAPLSSHKPIVAVVGDSAGVELTDFLVPHATLSESGVAQVIIVGARPIKFPLRPSTMMIDVDMTFTAFDAANPRGADYVIVPAMQDTKNAAVRRWLQEQAAKGATIVSICEGARVVAAAGLLDGRDATTHWRALKDLEKQYPRTTWIRDTRYVVDDHRISTTGVSASLPLSLFLIERIAGRSTADSAARRLGVTSWDTRHDTKSFRLTNWMYLRAATNYFAWWRHDIVAVPVTDGVDEVALALTMDAIPRTMRAKALTWSDKGGSVIGRQGLRISVDKSLADLDHSAKQFALPAKSASSASALDTAVVRLAAWYGRSAAELILIGMEYPPLTKRS